MNIIASIGRGDIVKCFNCEHPIKVGDKTVLTTLEGDYLVCPKCGKGYTLESYMLKGEFVSRGDDKPEVLELTNAQVYNHALFACKKQYGEYEDDLYKAIKKVLGKVLMGFEES